MAWAGTNNALCAVATISAGWQKAICIRGLAGVTRSACRVESYGLLQQVISSRRACAGFVWGLWRSLRTNRKIPRQWSAKSGSCSRILIGPVAKRITITTRAETSSSPQLTISGAGPVAATDAGTALLTVASVERKRDSATLNSSARHPDEFLMPLRRRSPCVRTAADRPLHSGFAYLLGLSPRKRRSCTIARTRSWKSPQCLSIFQPSRASALRLEKVD